MSKKVEEISRMIERRLKSFVIGLADPLKLPRLLEKRVNLDWYQRDAFGINWKGVYQGARGDGRGRRFKLKPMNFEKQKPKKGFEDIKKCMSLALLLQYIDNFYNYVTLVKIFEKCKKDEQDSLNIPTDKPSKKRNKKVFKKSKKFGIKSEFFKNLIKLESGNYYLLKFKLLTNLEDFKKFRETIIESYKKFIDMKKITETAIEVEEFLMLLWMITGEKLFGFKVSIDNFYTEKVDFLRNNKNFMSDNLHSGEIWSMIEIPKLQRSSKKQYISFLQIYWMVQYKKKLDFYNKKKGKTLFEMSNEFNNFDLFQEVKHNFSNCLAFMKSFFSSPFSFHCVKTIFRDFGSVIPLGDVIYERSFINEIFENQDGMIKRIKTQSILNFDYSIIHKYFKIDHSVLLEKLSKYFIGVNSEKKGMKITYFSSLLKIIKFINIKTHVKVSKIRNKRVNEIDQIMFKVKKNFFTVGASEKNSELRRSQGRGGKKFLMFEKKDNKEKLFENNFEQAQGLIYTRKSVKDFVKSLKQEEYQDRLRTGKLILTNKSLNPDLMSLRKRKEMEDGWMGNLKEGEEYNRKLKEFALKMLAMEFDFKVDINKIVRMASERVRFSDFKSNIDFTIYRTINIPKGAFFNNKSSFLGDKYYCKAKFKVFVRILSNHHFTNFAILEKIEVKANFPYLGSSSKVDIHEPCMIIKLLRLLSLRSEHIASLELYYLVFHLISFQTPKGIFFSLEKILNLSYKRESEIFSIPILDSIASNIDSSINSISISNFAFDQKSDSSFDMKNSNFLKNHWVKFNKKMMSNRRLRLGRINFRLLNKYAKFQDWRYVVSSNIEGFMNMTIQKNINSETIKSTNLKVLNQEKVKEKLMINDRFSLNHLRNIKNCKKDTFFILHKIEGMGMCEITISSFFVEIDYKQRLKLNRKNKYSFKKGGKLDLQHVFEEVVLRIQELYLKNYKMIQFVAKSFMERTSKQLPTPGSVDNRTKGKKLWDRAITNTKRVKKKLMKKKSIILKSRRSFFAFVNDKGEVDKSKVRSERQEDEEGRVQQYKYTKIFTNDELFLINYKIKVKSSKFRVQKLIINSHDINNFFNLEEFITYAFRTNKHESIIRKFRIVSVKHLIISLNRYILDKFCLYKTNLYNTLVMKTKVGKVRKIHKNIFNKYEHNTNIMISKFLDVISERYSVIHKCFTKIKKQYFLVTVKKDWLVGNIRICYYNPRFCRHYYVKVKAGEFEKLSEGFLCRFLLLLRKIDIEKLRETEGLNLYQNFDELVNMEDIKEKRALLSRRVSLKSKSDKSRYSPENRSERDGSGYDSSKYDVIDMLGKFSSGDLQRFFVYIDSKMSLGTVGEKIAHSVDLKNPSYHEDDDKEMTNRAFFLLYKKTERELRRFLVVKYWDGILKHLSIKESKQKNYCSFKLAGKSHILIESLISKHFQLNDKTEMIIEVNSKSTHYHNKDNKDKKDNKESEDNFNSNLSIFSKFSPIIYDNTSFYNLEIKLVTLKFNVKESDQDMMINKKLNLREVINLRLAEKSQRIKINKANNRVFLTHLHDLASFLIFKVKTSNIFNISLTMKDNDKSDSEGDTSSVTSDSQSSDGSHM